MSTYHFFPRYRRGWSASDIDASQPSITVKVPFVVTARGVDGSLTPHDYVHPITIHGPAEAPGIAADEISGIEPPDGVTDFEPNYLPYVTFRSPDLPWRYSADKGGPGGGKPWVALLVLAKGEFEEMADGSGGPRFSWFRLLAASRWPTPDQLARSAHVQLLQESAGGPTDLLAALDVAPGSVLTRLLSLRRLEERTEYHAFLVPTFRATVDAAAGRQGPNAVGEDFVPKAGDAVPYFRRHRFQTGAAGDFESLVRRLEPRRVQNLGLREVVVDAPGFGLPAVAWAGPEGRERHTLHVEGALRSLDVRPTAWGRDGVRQGPFEDALVDVLVDEAGTSDGSDPTVSPPLYGRWYAGRARAEAAVDTWFDAINLDPRHRVAARLGADLVRKHQEAFMAGAWAQRGDRRADELLQRAQLGRLVSYAVHRRAASAPPERYIGLYGPMLGRVLMANGHTVSSNIAASRLPPVALDPAFRRLARTRARVVPVASRPASGAAERINQAALSPAGPHPRPRGALGFATVVAGMLEDHPRLATVVDRMRPEEVTDEAVDCRALVRRRTPPPPLATRPAVTGPVRPPRGGIGTMPGGGVTDPSPLDDPIRGPGGRGTFELPPVTLTPGLGGSATTTQPPTLTSLLPKLCGAWLDPPVRAEKPPFDFPGAKASVSAQADPRVAIPARVHAQIRIDVPMHQPADPLAPLLAGPRFDQPLSELLISTSQDAFLPNADSIPQNTVGLLTTNRRFVEAVLVGANHEMGRELQWREYPSELRATYFRQFWDVSSASPTEQEWSTRVAEVEKVLPQHADEADAAYRARVDEVTRSSLVEDRFDVDPLHTWGTKSLGANDLTSRSDQLVLIVRGDLFKKYPKTKLYAVLGAGTPASPQLTEPVDLNAPGPNIRRPAFQGDLPTDMRFFGFPLTYAEIEYGTWFFVFEEDELSLRFGLDDNANAPPPSTWDDLAWAHVALATNGAISSVSTTPTNPGDRRWDGGAAHTAAVLFQRPVRISIAARRLLPR